MSKRYEVKRFNSCYLLNWIDNKTNKELTALEIEKIINQQSQQIAELEEQLNSAQVGEQFALKCCKEAEEQLKNAIVPKFNRQEHICSFAFGEIREYIVVAYLDNNITLCENIETSELEWCDNNFLVRTFEEAQAKLKELQLNDN